jgi:hypothetical protein
MHACLDEGLNISISLPVMDDLQLLYVLQVQGGLRHESRTHTGRLHSKNVRAVTFQSPFNLHEFRSYFQLGPFLIVRNTG